MMMYVIVVLDLFDEAALAVRARDVEGIEEVDESGAAVAPVGGWGRGEVGGVHS